MNYDGKPWEAVGAAIDTLIELASAIRKSTVSKQGLRWSSHFRRPDDAYLGEMTKLLVRKRFPDARRSLTDQLGYSIFVRRRRLMYQQSHEAKIPYLRHGTSPLPSDNGTVTSRFERRQQPAKSFAVNERRKVSSPFKPQIINPPPPNTELSKINKILLERRARTPTTLSGRSNGSTSCEEREPEYPKYPSFERDEEYCSCPYCFTPLLTAKMKPNWRSVIKNP